MSQIKVQVRLSRLLLTTREEIITLCDDMKRLDNGKSIELINPVDYPRDEFKHMFNGNKLISRWWHSTDPEDGIDKLVICMND